MSDVLKLDEALDIARQMRNHFRAFERIHELLLLVAEKRQGAEEAEKQKTMILAEIPAIQGRVDQMVRDHDSRKEKLDAEFRARQDGYERVLAGIAKEVAVKTDALNQSVALGQKDAELSIARIQQAVEARERAASEEIASIQNNADATASALHAKLQVMTDNFNIQEEEHRDHMRSFAREEEAAQRKLSALQEEWETLRSRVSKLL